MRDRCRKTKAGIRVKFNMEQLGCSVVIQACYASHTRITVVASNNHCEGASLASCSLELKTQELFSLPGIEVRMPDLSAS